MGINDRIREALASNTEIVKASGEINYKRAADWLSSERQISRQSVKSWCTDAKDIKRENVETVAKMTGRRLLWLLNGTEPKLSSEAASVPSRFKTETIRHADLYQRLPRRRREIIDSLMQDWFAETTDTAPHKRRASKTGEPINESG